MSVISSSLTFFIKYLMVVFSPVLLLIVNYDRFVYEDSTNWLMVAALIGFFAFLVFTFGRYKKVAILGNNLIVSNYFNSVSVPFDQLDRVVEKRAGRLRHICLVFRSKTIVGNSVLFLPKTKGNMYARHPIVEQLRLRISDARRDK